MPKHAAAPLLADFHLVIQSPTLDEATVATLAAAVGAREIVQLNDHAARLLGVTTDAAASALLRELCQTHAADCAYVPAGVRLRDCRVLAIDMDSTLINIECIDEIADIAGKKAEVAALTTAAMRGETKDYAESLRARVALLAGVPEAALAQVYDERLRVNPGTETLIARARAAGVYTMLVSGGFTYFTERLRARLNLDAAHANTLEVVDGHLTGRVLGPILDAAAKARLLTERADALGATPEERIAIGDGANDLAMLAQSHYAVAFHAKPIVQQQARYTINHCGLDAVLNWFE